MKYLTVSKCRKCRGSGYKSGIDIDRKKQVSTKGWCEKCEGAGHHIKNQGNLPTDCLPHTTGKIAVLRYRDVCRFSLHHPDDVLFDGDLE